MFSNQIERVLKPQVNSKYCKYIGCFPADQIPPKHTLPPRCSLVCNVDRANARGSHWICLVRDHDRIVYYCPLGREPKNEFLVYLKQFETVYYSPQRMQKPDTKSCGAFCCYLVHNLAIGVSMETILEQFHKNIKKDDLFVTTWLKLVHNITLK